MNIKMKIYTVRKTKVFTRICMYYMYIKFLSILETAGYISFTISKLHFQE